MRQAGQHRIGLERHLRPMPAGRPKPHHVARPEPGRETFPQPFPVGPGRGVEGLRRRCRKLEAGHSAAGIESLAALSEESEPPPGVAKPPARADFDPPPPVPRTIEVKHQDHLPRPEISPAEPGAQFLQ